MIVDQEALEELRYWLRHHTKDPCDAVLLLCAALVALQTDYGMISQDDFAEDVAEIIREARADLVKNN